MIKCGLRIYGEGGRFENTPDLLLGWAKNGRVPIQGFFAALRMTAFVETALGGGVTAFWGDGVGG